MTSSSEPFSRTFDNWFFEGRRDDALKAALAAGYRTAWKGASEDQIVVLAFVYWSKHEEGYDLLLEGLRSEWSDVAHTAVGYVCSLLAEGYSFAASLRPDLEAFMRRWPRAQGLAQKALDSLPA